jgi:hypothetical protein
VAIFAHDQLTLLHYDKFLHVISEITLLQDLQIYKPELSNIQQTNSISLPKHSIFLDDIALQCKSSHINAVSNCLIEQAVTI